MAENQCLPQVSACVIRVAELDPSGVPNPGAGNLYTTNSLVTMTVTPVYTDGDDLEQKNACGDNCGAYKNADSFKRIDVTIQLCTPEPTLAAQLSNGAVLLDGARTGYGAPPIGPVPNTAVSIELWAKRIDDGDLDIDSPYAWWAYPKIKNLRVNAWTHQNGFLLPEFAGQGYENPNWFDGPLNDWPAASDRVWQWLPTDTLPTVTCGAQSLAAS